MCFIKLLINFKILEGGLKVNDLIDKFLEGEIRVNCKTEKQAEEFMLYLSRRGYKWCSGSSLLDYTKWEVYGEDTVYICYCYNRMIAYDSKNYYNDSTIVEYKNLCNKFRRL